MAGMVSAPMAATVAGPEPLRAPKNMQVTMAIKPMPPYRPPTISSASLSSRCERPPAPMNTPAAMKNGMAMMGKLSMEVKEICAMYSMGSVSALMMVASVERPRQMAMGTPMAQSTTK